MKAISMVMVFALALSGCCATRAMDGGGDQQAPAPKLARPRNGWQTPSPQLRKRNNVQSSNSGYIEVKVSLTDLSPYYDGIRAIMTEGKLKGIEINPYDRSLSLFTFKVPITNPLITYMPDSIRISRNAQKLTLDEKQKIADYVRVTTQRIIENALEGTHFLFDLEDVAVDGGNAEAYFIPIEQDRERFNALLRAICNELKQAYRWEQDSHDGICFNLENQGALRPSMIFLHEVENQSGLVRLKRAVASKLSPRLARNFQDDSTQGRLSQSGPVLSRSSRDEMLSRNSMGSHAPLRLSSHRDSSSFETSPSRSPEVSPRDSSGKVSPRNKLWADIAPMFSLSDNTVRVETAIIHENGGKR